MKSAPPLHLILDLETAPDPHVPAPTPKLEHFQIASGAFHPPELEFELRKTGLFPPPPCHRIVCAGYAWLEDYELVSWGVLDGIEDEEPGPENLPPRTRAITSERDILERLTVTIGKSSPVITGCNTRGFDLPVLAARCFAHGVPFPWYYATKYPRYRYAQSAHFDLMDFLSDHGAAPKASFDAWCKACGLPGKMGIDGSEVASLFKEGKLQQIADYCMTDVAGSAALLLRVELLRGVLSPARYRKAARTLVRAMEKDLRTAALAARIDRERFFLEEPPPYVCPTTGLRSDPAALLTLPATGARAPTDAPNPSVEAPAEVGITARRPAGAKRPALSKETR